MRDAEILERLCDLFNEVCHAPETSRNACAAKPVSVCLPPAATSANGAKDPRAGRSPPLTSPPLAKSDVFASRATPFPKIRITTAVLRKMVSGFRLTERAVPATRLPMTTNRENTPWERVMMRLPVCCSARSARELMAISDAPEATPSRSIEMDAETKSCAVAPTIVAATAREISMMPATHTPHRSTARPERSIAGSAPTPMKSKTVPNSASVREAWLRKAGSSAPHVPQNSPNAVDKRREGHVRSPRQNQHHPTLLPY